jgi:prepilin signal peptidase PulO-like enzyme (type II secretory pathway)
MAYIVMSAIITHMPLVLFILGLALGVLINSLADNLPPDADNRRYPPRRPRCRTCGQVHEPVYMSALASLILRRGRCEHCGAPRPWRQVAVELAAGLALAYAWNWAGQAGVPALDIGLRFVGAAVVLSIFLLVIVIDIEHRLILWSVVLPSAIALAIVCSLMPGHGVVKTLAGGAAGYGIAFAIFLLAELFARLLQRLRGQALSEVAFGGGDVNLAGLVGLAVGWPGVLLALMITVLAGGLYSLGYIVVQVLRRRYVPYSAIPYGPFLVLGALTNFFYGTEFAAAWLGRQ